MGLPIQGTPMPRPTRRRRVAPRKGMKAVEAISGHAVTATTNSTLTGVRQK